MKVFSNRDTADIVTMIGISANKVLTGSKNGEIKLWTLTQSSNTYDFHCDLIFSGHLGQVCYLAPLPNGRFISSSEDGSMRVWKHESGNCEKVLKGGCVRPHRCEAIVALPNNLIAVAGSCSPAWGCFDVWDINTGECLFSDNALMHGFRGMALARTIHGYLAVHGYCEGILSLWRISATECVQVSKYDNERIYSMTVSPIGEIITGGFNLNIFTCDEKGSLQKEKTIENTNVIDTIIPLDGYNVLIVDRQGANSGTLKLVNYLSETSKTLGNSRTPSGEIADGHVVLAGSRILLSISTGQFCIQSFPELLQVPKSFTELRKNARTVAQAVRTQTSFFARLPIELNFKIVTLTDSSSNEKTSMKIASDHFCKPPSL